jgi:hypothetical protein
MLGAALLVHNEVETVGKLKPPCAFAVEKHIILIAESMSSSATARLKFLGRTIAIFLFQIV